MEAATGIVSDKVLRHPPGLLVLDAERRHRLVDETEKRAGIGGSGRGRAGREGAAGRGPEGDSQCRGGERNGTR